MKKELTYFNIEDSYGGNQKWFKNLIMKFGGCAAITACDLCIYLSIIKEVKDLYLRGITPHAIGYQEWLPYFKGEIGLEEVISEIQKNSRHLAKRQMTWFKNQMTTHFYEVNLNDINETIELIYKDLLSFLGGE